MAANNVPTPPPTGAAGGKKDKEPEIDYSKYLPALLAEKESLDASFEYCMKFLTAEITRVRKGEPKPEGVNLHDLFLAKPIKLKERVLIPTKRFPGYPFVGKLIGPGGTTVKELQERTGARISVLGKGSMKDKSKEDALRKTGEQKYQHLGMDLHVLIEVHATSPDVYLRMAHAMEEVKKFLIPEPHEQEQFMDPNFTNGGPGGAGPGQGGPPPPLGPPPGFRGGMPGGMGGGTMTPPFPPPPFGGPPPRGTMRGGMSSRGGGPPGGIGGRGNPNLTPIRGGAGTLGRGLPPGAPRMLPPQALGGLQEQESAQQQTPQQAKVPELVRYPLVPYPISYDESFSDSASFDAIAASFGVEQQPGQATVNPEYYGYGQETQQSQETTAGEAVGAQPPPWAATGGKSPSARGAKTTTREQAHPYTRPWNVY